MESSGSRSSRRHGGAHGYCNIYGRRAGRGVRPFFLVAKLLGVSAFIGGLIAVLAVVALPSLPRDLDRWRMEGDLWPRFYGKAIVPGLNAALVCGTLLMASMWRTIIRMRWLQVKLVVIVVTIPSLHLYMSGKAFELHNLLNQTSPDLTRAITIHGELMTGSLAALGVAVLLLVLGRVKPRLGQDYGRTLARTE